MKKLLLITLIFYSLLGNLDSINAQMVYMPDSMLRLKLANLGYGSCIVGDSIDSTCPQILSELNLNISSSSIRNLQGIQVFSNLTDLNCGNNKGLSIPILPASLKLLMCYEDSLIVLPALPVNLTFLDASTNNFASLPTIPSSLENLYVKSNHLINLPILPIGLRYLVCSGNNLNNIPFLPDSLRALNCGYNPISNLPALPNFLEFLSCENTSVSIIPNLPSSLTSLRCSDNSLYYLPLLPSGLQDLYCSNDSLYVLPALPDSLNYFICDGNHLSRIPSLPQNLEYFYCNNNLLRDLPSLPNNLRWLQVNSNKISYLPSIPNSLVFLDCSANLLTSLPSIISSNIYSLSCSGNSITSLPALPNTLSHLNCQNNLLSNLPALPVGLDQLFCDHNHLAFIPDLPDSLKLLNCQHNDSLHCLPKLKYINQLYFSNCPIGCLPNYGNVVISNPPLSSLPLCDIFNSNACIISWNISGKIYFDTNLNCNQTMNESGLHNMHLKLYENGNLIQQAFTGGEGFYSFDINNFNNYEVQLDTSDIPFTSICPSSNNYLDTISISDSLIYGNDFALKCKSGFDIGVWSIYSPGFRPASRSLVNVRAGDIANFYGVHCTSGISGTLNITINGYAHYYGPIAGARTPSNVTGNIITYNITDFGLINSNTDFAFEVETDTSAISGSQICIFASFLPTVGDYNVSNNSLSNCFTVRASFDPNDKEVYPAGITDTSQHWLTYTIRFQNTGSAPADNIYILDTLDNNLDVSSFKLLASSHPLYAQILEGGIARFNFPNINLPDSNDNEPLSHGYVQYKIKLKDNLTIGTQIQNTAYIYFDFNAPVVTNTTSNTIDIVNGISSQAKLLQLKIWPVPFENTFIIQTDESVTGSHFSIVNLIGREIKSGKINSTLMKVNSESWSSGIYFLRIENMNGIEVKKLIKR